MVYHVSRGRVRIIFIIYSALLLIFIQNSALGGEADPERQTNQPIAKWQLKFSVGPNFTIRQFEGFKFFLQRSVSTRGAIRFGIGLDGNYYSYDIDRFNIYPEEHFYRENNRDRKVTIVTTTINYIRYLSGRGSITPFWGIGPVFDFSKDNWNDVSRNPENPPNRNSYNSDTKIFKVGITTIIGAEWRLNNTLNLQIESGLRYLYERMRRDNTSESVSASSTRVTHDSRSSDSIKIISDSVRIGLSLVF